ncbi:LuxR family transcriptional regulator [Cupriavidus malaysiensis]|uniref:HTH luxR-type domain-containing protein n=1 Tax=Cupriavidus malaysiensis TaxID=367825 RepID=A0ABM6FDG0_9BURK|nr:LuxR family transcriptional regulator [Cupriavidus malaysiensis]AOZ09835.1 hypothetical protein BKK80_29505 [Cupriavidus malaysiensis]
MPQDLAFLDTLLHADSRRALIDHTSRWLDGLGFHCFLYAEHRPVRADGKRARFVFDGIDGSAAAGAAWHRLSTLPPAWARHYRAAGYLALDPLVRHAATAGLPLPWHRRGADSPAAARLFAEARQHGLAGGIVVPLRGAHGATALLNAATAHDGEAARRRLDQVVARVTLLGLYLHEAVRRLSTPPRAGAPALTAREQQCLARAAAGGSAREIGRQLGISERTAVFHLANAARKLGARNRREAVARAILAGLAVP